ncbi:MAG TPA: hypothetical protein VMR86_16785 [Myxococcota bacterium]|nr:hypothetical protein [Myxococcota bacterium]
MTVVVPLLAPSPAGKPLQALFDQVQASVWQDGAQSGPIPFAHMRSVHFARFALSEADLAPDGTPIPACLLFSTEFDGELDAHLDELVSHAAGPLETIFSECEGFAAQGGDPATRICNFLKAKRSRPSAFFVGAVGRTVEQIHQEQQRSQQIRQAACALDPELDPVLVWHELRKQVDTTGWGGPRSAKNTESHRVWREVIFWLVTAGLLILAAFLLVAHPWLIAPGVYVAFWLRLLEQNEADQVAAQRAAQSQAQQSEQDDRREKLHARFEDRWEQNQLTAITLIARSPLRRGLQRLVLAGSHFRARFHFTRGLLDGVPTIHFAHWHVIEKGSRLVFVSNYDGSWASYLDSFTLHAAGPMSAIWSQSVGFPPTRFLLWGGAEDGPCFKQFARRHQVAPSVFYSAYPQLSVEEINRNSELVGGLQDPRLGEARNRLETREWLCNI